MSDNFAMIDFPKSPFNIQQFFGNLVPGACLVLCVYLFESNFSIGGALVDSVYLPMHHIMVKLAHYSDGNTVAQQAGLWVILLLIVYTTGHFISIVGNIILDRIVIFKGYGYPYQFLLLQDGSSPAYPKDLKMLFYRGTFFWFNVWLLGWAGVRIYKAASFGGLQYIEIMSGFISVIVIKVICRKVISQRIYYENIMSWLSKHSILSFVIMKNMPIWRLLLIIYAWPFNFLASQIENYTRSNAQLEPQIRDIYKCMFKKRFGIPAESAASNNYWFSLYYVKQNDARIGAILSHCLQTSQFARNMSTAFFLAYFYGVIYLFYCDTLIPISEMNYLFGLLSVLLSLAILMGISYYYVHVSYYNKCLYRAFVYLHLLTTRLIYSADEY